MANLAKMKLARGPGWFVTCAWIALPRLQPALGLARAFVLPHLPHPLVHLRYPQSLSLLVRRNRAKGISCRGAVIACRSYLFDATTSTESRVYRPVFLVFALLILVLRGSETQLELRVAETNGGAHSIQ